MSTHFITVYDEHGTDHFINVAHIVQVTKGGDGERTRLWLTNKIGCLVVYGTPEADDIDDVHQNVIDQITGGGQR